MANDSGMAVAAYVLTYTLIRKLEAKNVLKHAEAEELIEGAIRQLRGPDAGEAAVREAQSILRETLNLVREEGATSDANS